MELTKHNNWYAYLGLSPDATTEEIQSGVERLSRQASALAATSPERSQLLRETIRAIKRDLLSGPEDRAADKAARARPTDAVRPAPAARPRLPFDVTLGPTPPQSAPIPSAPAPIPSGPASAPSGPASAPTGSAAYPPAGQTVGTRLARFLRTGWTCPACGKGGVPSDKFCTRCGTPIQAVRPDGGPGPDRAPRPTCAACANPLGPTEAFCSRCGIRAGRTYQ